MACASGGPDQEGNIIPAGVQEGSAKIVGLEANNQHILLDVDGGIYNVRKATCYNYCVTCDGSTSYAVSANPFSLAVNGQTQEHLYATWDTGMQYDYTSNSTWNSSNTGIATVQTGLVKGVSPGSFTVNGGTTGEPVYVTICASQAPGCPRDGGGGGSSPGDIVSLSCSPSVVTRGGFVSCTVTAPTGSTFSSWSFTDGTNLVHGTGNVSKAWSGTMVTSGVVSVKVTGSDGSISTPSQSVTVIARSGWALSPKPSTRRANPYTCQNSEVLSVPNTPFLGSFVGQNCPVPHFIAQPSGINSGPNTGYNYITSVTDSGEYSWVIAGDIDAPTSAFYKAQCGNYNISTNPTGFISGATLDADDQRHEGGTVNAHYAEYSSAYNNSSNNPGTVMEPFVEFTTSSGYSDDVVNKLTALQTAIFNAAVPEPCMQKYVGYSASCTYDGGINYAPSCP